MGAGPCSTTGGGTLNDSWGWDPHYQPCPVPEAILYYNMGPQWWEDSDKQQHTYTTLCKHSPHSALSVCACVYPYCSSDHCLSGKVEAHDAGATEHADSCLADLTQTLVYALCRGREGNGEGGVYGRPYLPTIFCTQKHQCGVVWCVVTLTGSCFLRKG